MRSKICPYWGIFLSFVLLLSTNDFTNAMNKQDKGFSTSSGLTKINYLRQSLTDNTDGDLRGDPFITFEMEAAGIPYVECVSGTIGISGNQQPFEMCDGWDGRKEDIQIRHAKFSAEIEAVDIFIIAQNKSSKSVVDVSRMDFNTSAFVTTVGVVGSNSGDSNAFLRVQVGNEEEPLEVGGKTCAQGTTCYYPYSGETIKERVKGIEVHGITDSYIIKQYDDSIMPFIELEGDMSVSYSTEGVVHVSTTAPEEDLVLEVVVYDEKDPHNIVSKDEKYKCKANRISNQTYSCSQEIQVTKELKSVWVLVVEISNDRNTVVKSTRKKIPINTSSGVEVWVIVVSTLGGLCGVILIGAAIFFTWKKRSTRNQKIAITSKVDNITMENKSNIPNESCFENEVENQNGNEKKTNYGNETENQNGDEKKTNNENEEENHYENKEENHYETIE